LNTVTTTETPKRRLRSQALLESGVLLAALVGFNLLLAPDDPGFVSWSPHPTLWITLLILIRYGVVAGLLAAGLSVATYAGLLLALADVPTFLHFMAPPYSTPVVALVPATVIFGVLVQRHIDRLALAENTAQGLASENQQIKQEQARLRDVNVELAGKVVGAGETLASLYRYAKTLNVDNVEKIYQGLTLMLREVVKADAVSVWSVSPSGEMTIAARLGSDRGRRQLQIDQKTAGLFGPEGVLAVHELPPEMRTPDMPPLVGRITAGRGGGLHAYLTIDKLPFVRYSPETIRLFAMVVDWASASVGNALAFQRMSPEERASRRRAKRAAAHDDSVAESSQLVDLVGDAAAQLDAGSARPTPEPMERVDSLMDVVSGAAVDLSAAAGRPSPTPQMGDATIALLGLLEDADNLLAKRSKTLAAARATEPAKPNDVAVASTAEPAESDDVAAMAEEVERTCVVNEPLGRLLHGIGDYMEGEKK
jgi:hypothetical protein